MGIISNRRQTIIYTNNGIFTLPSWVNTRPYSAPRMKPTDPRMKSPSCNENIVLSQSQHIMQIRRLKFVFNALTNCCREKKCHHFAEDISHQFSNMSIDLFGLKFHWILFPTVQFTTCQHLPKERLGTKQPISHDLNQWWHFLHDACMCHSGTFPYFSLYWYRSICRQWNNTNGPFYWHR